MLGDHVKLADLGSCKGIFSDHPYTEYISTRWYRAPECLLTDGYYGSQVLFNYNLRWISGVLVVCFLKLYRFSQLFREMTN